MSVRLRKGGFMVDTLGHYIFSPNVVFEKLELYTASVSSSTGDLPEATGSNRGQFPRTDFGPEKRMCSSSNTAKTPEATRVWGKSSIYLTCCGPHNLT